MKHLYACLYSLECTHFTITDNSFVVLLTARSLPCEAWGIKGQVMVKGWRRVKRGMIGGMNREDIGLCSVI